MQIIVINIFTKCQFQVRKIKNCSNFLEGHLLEQRITGQVKSSPCYAKCMMRLRSLREMTKSKISSNIEIVDN